MAITPNGYAPLVQRGSLVRGSLEGVIIKGLLDSRKSEVGWGPIKIFNSIGRVSCL